MEGKTDVIRGVWTKTAAISPQSSRPPLDQLITELAERQHGVVALVQLVELGLSARAVRGRVEAGRLHRVHAGVYAVGRRSLTSHGRWMAAVLACGVGSVLCHQSAALLLGLLEGAGGAEVHVTAPGRRGRSRAGIAAHSAERLTPDDVTSVEGIPCTTVARTLLDLADDLSCDRLERACDRAEMLRRFDGRAMDAVLARAQGRRGAARLAAVLAGLDGRAGLTRTDIERRFLALCRAVGLPRPRVNHPLQLDGASFVADFLWLRDRLIVETDGRASHGTRRAFESDRRRDQFLAVAGYRVVRFTDRQLKTEPDRVAAVVTALLRS